ncbi:MBL fold metallo-hydrolase [Streptomyces albiaxialis]|uniref:MBL fold metallo-hydrolase n=1 Tax=Streptomyces albiaxialis TaxID=329523 RepID=A0ABP5I6K9_9ACTN
MPQSWTVGGLRVHRIDETTFPPGTGSWILPDAATPEVVRRFPWLQPDFATPDGGLLMSSHTFAFEAADGRRVLVDTGVGNGRKRANPFWNDLDTPYLDRLAEAGFAPDSVDLVVLTHLHTDHVGWNTRDDGGTWVPTFPRARYLTSRAEWDHWASVEMEESRRQMFRDAVLPVRDAGLLDLVDVEEGGTEIAPGVRLLPAPGHTPGQFAVELTDGAGATGGTETALITGDSVHHPVQLGDPALNSRVDSDPEDAVRSRRALLDRLADSGALLLGTHFPPPTAGRVRREGDAYRLEPVAPVVTPSAAG